MIATLAALAFAAGALVVMALTIGGLDKDLPSCDLCDRPGRWTTWRAGRSGRRCDAHAWRSTP